MSISDEGLFPAMGENIAKLVFVLQLIIKDGLFFMFIYIKILSFSSNLFNSIVKFYSNGFQNVNFKLSNITQTKFLF
jgi:hypothetical protein